MPATTIAIPSAPTGETDSPSRGTAISGRKAGVERMIG